MGLSTWLWGKGNTQEWVLSDVQQCLGQALPCQTLIIRAKHKYKYYPHVTVGSDRVIFRAVGGQLLETGIWTACLLAGASPGSKDKRYLGC